MFFYLGSANAAKPVVPPHGEKEKGGRERWLGDVKNTNTNSCPMQKPHKTH